MGLYNWVNRMYTNYPRLKQVSSLFAVNIVMIPLSIVSNIFITRFLGAELYGDFKFLSYIFGTAIVFFNFGLFYAGNRTIVLNSDKEKNREYYGTMLILTGAIFMTMCLFLIAYAFIDKNIVEKGLRSMFLMLIPFSWIFLMTTYFETLFQADNRISLLAKSRLYPKVIFLIVTIGALLILSNYSGDRLKVIWVLFIAAHICGFGYIIYKVKPAFTNIRQRTKEVFHFNKTYGFNVYIGTLFNVATLSVSGMLISYFGATNAGVGFFGLALTIAEPLNVIPNVIATTHYKEFASKKSIERRLTMITVGISTSALLLCWLLVGPFINIFYGKEFSPVIFLTFIVSSGVIFQGMGDYFNRFLGAHGQGKALRNSAMIVGIVIVVCSFTLIPLFGQNGAAITRILSGITYLSCMYWFYRKLVKQLNEADTDTNPETQPAA